nr:MAG TPA: hypothetical protein [Caudoviricetes sp.]
MSSLFALPLPIRHQTRHHRPIQKFPPLSGGN